MLDIGEITPAATRLFTLEHQSARAPERPITKYIIMVTVRVIHSSIDSTTFIFPPILRVRKSMQKITTTIALLQQFRVGSHLYHSDAARVWLASRRLLFRVIMNRNAGYAKCISHRSSLASAFPGFGPSASPLIEVRVIVCTNVAELMRTRSQSI